MAASGSQNICFYFSRDGLQQLLTRAGFKVVKHMYISRIPYTVLSQKYQLAGFSRKLANFSVKVLQYFPMKICDLTGFGMMHNIWAQPLIEPVT